MSDIVLTVEGLTKKYTIGANRERYVALRDVLVRKVRQSVKTLGAIGGNGSRESTPPDNEIYALKDVSFEVRQGEVVGIIGRNGAGKSALLKILSRITEPTEGRVRIRGRVASLLEVGTRFHPELTGRENIFLNGAILGMSRQEIRRKFDEIVAFAQAYPDPMVVHQTHAEPWRVPLVDPGEQTMTGGRLKRVASYIVKLLYNYLVTGRHSRKACSWLRTGTGKPGEAQH